MRNLAYDVLRHYLKCEPPDTRKLKTVKDGLFRSERLTIRSGQINSERKDTMNMRKWKKLVRHLLTNVR